MIARMRDDRGVSLVEMMVAVGVLGVLMALVSGFFLTAYGGMRDASGMSQVQQEQRNAMLRIATALRYADNATEGTTPGAAFLRAADDSVTFYSRSRMEPSQSSPNQVSIYVTTTQPNPGLVITTVAPGSTPVTTTAIRTEPGHTPRVSFTYLDAQGQPITAAARAVTGWEKKLRSIRVSLSDSASRIGVEETVVLVNAL